MDLRAAAAGLSRAVGARGLLLVFLAVTALFVVGVALLLGKIVESAIREEALSGAERTARTFAELSFQRDEVENGELTRESIRDLDEAVRTSSVVTDLHLFDASGEPIYSRDPQVGAERLAPAELVAAQRGETFTEVTSFSTDHLGRDRGEESLELLKADVAINAAGGELLAVLTTYSSYAPVAAQISDAAEVANLALAGAALALYLLLVPGIARASRTLATSFDPDREFVCRQLPRGIRDREIVLHYQPKVSLARGEPIGVEGLVRWLHPERGLISPGEFLPAAEQTDLIDDLTAHVAELACEQLAVWERQGLGLPIAINLSPRNLREEGLPDRLAALAARHSVLPSRLILEVTETAAIEDRDTSIRTLDRLSNLGFRISIDDFGTGQSSLVRLGQMPLDELKLDREFTVGLGADSALVAAIIGLAHDLGLPVVAEGVEDAATVARLRELGCDLAQGYYFCRPLAPAAITAWLAERAGARRAKVPATGPMGRKRQPVVIAERFGTATQPR